MWEYVVRNCKNAALIINFDACQFVISDGMKRKRIYTTKAFKTSKYKPISDTEVGDTMGFAIKFFNICTLSGQGPIHLVFLLADPDMDKTAFEYIEVRGLSLGVAPQATGYICFCHNRCGNDKFFNWFISNILLRYVLDMRAYYPIDNSNKAFICCDGEGIQINAFFDQQVLELYDSHDIMVGKLPASTTAITQPSDCYKIFSATKTILTNITTSEAKTYDFMLKNITKKIM
jgi:hypothetical protein